jgi:phosphatidylglycerophosphate synthase
MNLPNAITVGRIAVTPLVAWLPFAPSWPLRLLGFALYIAAAVTDYYDGMLARSRGLVTDLGRLLDPLADKLLLLGTLLPMYLLQHPPGDLVARVWRPRDTAGQFPFVLPWGGDAYLPWWVVAVVLGRELFMTLFRQAAARRGVVIAAIGPAKWKTGFQSTWVGAAFLWFSAATAAERFGWTSPWWRAFAHFNGLVGVLAMIAAVFLTLYSLALYMRRYGGLFFKPAEKPHTGR